MDKHLGWITLALLLGLIGFIAGYTVGAQDRSVRIRIPGLERK